MAVCYYGRTDVKMLRIDIEYRSEIQNNWEGEKGSAEGKLTVMQDCRARGRSREGMRVEHPGPPGCLCGVIGFMLRLKSVSTKGRSVLLG